MTRPCAAPWFGAQEMARYVESGTLDAGITGKDWIMENNADVEPIIDLVYSKASFQPTRWVLAIPQDSPIRDISDLNGKKIATELVHYTQRYFDERGSPGRCRVFLGSDRGQGRRWPG